MIIDAIIAMKLAIVIVRMSRFLTCESSCASTASSSSLFKRRMIESVQATTACFGLRPVANAFGTGVWMIATRGFGIPASCGKFLHHPVQFGIFIIRNDPRTRRPEHELVGEEYGQFPFQMQKNKINRCGTPKCPKDTAKNTIYTINNKHHVSQTLLVRPQSRFHCIVGIISDAETLKSFDTIAVNYSDFSAFFHFKEDHSPFLGLHTSFLPLFKKHQNRNLFSAEHRTVTICEVDSEALADAAYGIFEHSRRESDKGRAGSFCARGRRH